MLGKLSVGADASVQSLWRFDADIHHRLPHGHAEEVEVLVRLRSVTHEHRVGLGLRDPPNLRKGLVVRYVLVTAPGAPLLESQPPSLVLAHDLCADPNADAQVVKKGAENRCALEYHRWDEDEALERDPDILVSLIEADLPVVLELEAAHVVRALDHGRVVVHMLEEQSGYMVLVGEHISLACGLCPNLCRDRPDWLSGQRKKR
mmetsp:Transcript_7417/g.18848  ORF Transcript_7417/g.18848 Transcript_7417/m.18848 type:complete len:204 (+) Transcript_7417:676-1287(+)